MVNIETFNFTKYGFVHGKVTKVSHDAAVDHDRGLVYTAHVALQESAMLVDGERATLTPGMAVSAEVKTGDRRG